MKIEHLVLGAGGLAFAGMIIGALVSSGLYEPNAREALKEVKREQVRNQTQEMTTSNQMLATPKGNTAQQTTGGELAWNRPDAQMGQMQALTQAKTLKYEGNVLRMISRGDTIGWGQVHIWVDTGPGVSKEVSIGPNWFLNHLGCRLSKNKMVRGVAYKFDKNDPNGLLYAKNIVVDGITCRLRNDEGFALWSNRLG
ncbi:putative Magnetosome protein MamS [Candidatus Terasakiella magnetica]|uniref:Putative Magnetosome protein MamS n=1 Tax=Candidatus Terasakiella magnetica TaxID=1867952 RepID=A0A1C3RH65_9PROT|nr:magnetosome protein MamS [Candidatus Terasakiella magnetica]SCA56620.1 putative Magnetosome protein MamS [Candidatus Terasakiella magnetica]